MRGAVWLAIVVLGGRTDAAFIPNSVVCDSSGAGTSLRASRCVPFTRAKISVLSRCGGSAFSQSDLASHELQQLHAKAERGNGGHIRCAAVDIPVAVRGDDDGEQRLQGGEKGKGLEGGPQENSNDDAGRPKGGERFLEQNAFDLVRWRSNGAQHVLRPRHARNDLLGSEKPSGLKHDEPAGKKSGETQYVRSRKCMLTFTRLLCSSKHETETRSSKA